MLELENINSLLLRNSRKWWSMMGIELLFPNDQRVEAKKRRRKWIEFVKAKRVRWEPTINSRICPAHFKPKDFVRCFAAWPGQTSALLPRLITDDTGIAAVPSSHAVDNGNNKTSDLEMKRHSRRVSIRNIFFSLDDNKKSSVHILFLYITGNEGDNGRSIVLYIWSCGRWRARRSRPCSIMFSVLTNNKDGEYRQIRYCCFLLVSRS